MADDTSQPLERIAQLCERMESVVSGMETRALGMAGGDRTVALHLEECFAGFCDQLGAFASQVEHSRVSASADVSHQARNQQIEADTEQIDEQSISTDCSYQTAAEYGDVHVSELEGKIEFLKTEHDSEIRKLNQMHLVEMKAVKDALENRLRSQIKALEEAQEKERQNLITDLEQALQNERQNHTTVLADILQPSLHGHAAAMAEALRKERQGHTKALKRAQKLNDDLKRSFDATLQVYRETQEAHQQELEDLQQELRAQTDAQATISTGNYSQDIKLMKESFDEKVNSLKVEYQIRLEVGRHQHTATVMALEKRLKEAYGSLRSDSIPDFDFNFDSDGSVDPSRSHSTGRPSAEVERQQSPVRKRHHDDVSDDSSDGYEKSRSKIARNASEASPRADSEDLQISEDLSDQVFPIDIEVKTPAEQKAQKIWEKMLPDWEITPEEKEIIRAQLASAFTKQRSVESMTNLIDRYIVGSSIEEPPFPKACFFGSILQHKAGPGGPKMTAKSCPYCRKKEGRICLWAIHAPTVASGFPPRINGRYDARVGWQSSAQPQTVKVSGQEIRWILKRRKKVADEDDDPQFIMKKLKWA